MSAHFALQALLKATAANAAILAQGAGRTLPERPHMRPVVTYLFKPTGFVLLAQGEQDDLHEWPVKSSNHFKMDAFSAIPEILDAALDLQSCLQSYKGLVNQCSYLGVNMLFLRAHLAQDPTNHEISGALAGQPLILNSQTPLPLMHWMDAFSRREPLLDLTKTDKGTSCWYVESGQGNNTSRSHLRADTSQNAVMLHYALGSNHNLDAYPSEKVRAFQEMPL